MNHRLNDLTYPGYQGGIYNWNVLHIASILNEYPIATKSAKGWHYTSAKEMMRTLLSTKS